MKLKLIYSDSKEVIGNNINLDQRPNKITISTKSKELPNNYTEKETFDIFKDERDPHKRFEGLFDGRTYDDGRFILVTNEEYNNLISNNSCN